jgi:uncharacterized protein (DUF1499 family)
MIIKIVLTLLVVLIVLVSVYFFYLSFSARPPQARQDKTSLPPCPDKPNCVSSLSKTADAAISPIHYSLTDEQAWKNMITVLTDVGGSIVEEDKTYLRATFTSQIFRFVDDLELLQDRENKIIHIRSASRSGHSDLGVNRKRVEKIRVAFKAKHN